MSEPVGNSPRGIDIPSNALRDRKAEPEPEVEAAPLTKIAQGKVVVKKDGVLKRAGKSIIAEDASSVGDYILVDVVVPAFKRMIADMVKGGIDRVLFGSTRPSGRSSGPRQSLRTQYNTDSRDRDEPRRMPREARAKHDFNSVVLESRAEAVEVIDRLIDRVEEYKSASVADLYDYIGVTGSFQDRKWGWKNLSDADVRQSHGGWLLVLPSPEPLR